MTTYAYARRQMTFAEFKKEVREDLSLSWDTLRPHDQVRAIIQFADELRWDELISTRTLEAANNWANRIDSKA